MAQKLKYSLTGSPKKDILLFLHGIGTASWGWWQQEEAFKENFAVLVVDLPGHGESAHIPWVNMEQTVARVAEAIPENRKVHVVGISLGGHVALDLTRKFPHKIASTYISGITTKPMGPMIFKPLLPLYLHQISKLQNNERKMRELFIQMGIPHEKISAAISEYRKVSTDTYRAIFNDLYSFEMDQTYNKIKTPIMFVACEYEEKGIQDTLDYAPTIIPHAQTRFIKGARHQWPVQKPVLFDQELSKWFAQVSSVEYPL